MKEELINEILNRVNLKKEPLENLDEEVLERLCLIDDNNDLEIIIKAITAKKQDTSLNMAYINAFLMNTYVNTIFYANMDANLKEEALKKAALAKYDFQAKYIYNIYDSDEIKHKGLVADLILKCRADFQAYAIYDLMASIEWEDKEHLFAEYLELAKIISQERDEYKVDCYYNLDNNKNIVELGLLIPIAKLIGKSHCEKQAINIYQYLKKLDRENASYVLKNSELFFKTKDEDKLNSVYRYLIYCLNHKLLVEEDKVNLIIKARNKFNRDKIREALTSEDLLETNLEREASQILDDSRKEYNALYASKLTKLANFDSLSGAMIVNESETKYKASKVYSLISLYANTDEIGNSLEFASLINSVYTKIEIDLIYLLSQNVYLNKLDIALSIARVIGESTGYEEDVIKIWECLKIEENRQIAMKGFNSLIENIDPKNIKKAQKIIRGVLLQAKSCLKDFMEEEKSLKMLTRKKLK